MDFKTEQTIEKANILIEALPYIQKFNGKTVVEDPEKLIWERSYETPVFETVKDEVMDIRILVYTRDFLGSRGAGFSDGIYMQNV